MPEIRCSLCQGQACEENCGRCEHAFDGPDSHKVCTMCGGKGVVNDPLREREPNEPEPIKYMDMAEFQEGGYLQEANRQFFHPLGLALEWNSGLNEEGIKQAINRLAEDGWTNWALLHRAGHLTTAREAVMELLRELGFDKPRITGVWDYRDDPEGMEFNWEDMDHAEAIRKYINVQEEFVRHIPARRALFGEDGMEQPSVLVTSIQALPRRHEP